jgi:DNA-binding NtrC family response regulator
MVVLHQDQPAPWITALERAVAQSPEREPWTRFRLVAATDSAAGRQLLDRVPEQSLCRTVVVLGQARNPGEQWDLLKRGIGDVLVWQDDRTMEAVLARLQRWSAIDLVLESRTVRDRFIGESPRLTAALRELIELAMFGRGPILLTGETGTGKELASQVVHDLTGEPGERGKGDLVVVDCTTIVPTLSGSELFGHERGAFTGAERARSGAVWLADGGTLFLDEIGDLPLPLQAEFLRVIQEGRFKTVGGSSWASTSFRLVSATNRDLEREQRRGHFRADLYHRIAAGTVAFPALRERREDIPDLFVHFLGTGSRPEPSDLSPEVREYLCARPYPGNLRQLRQLALRVAARHVGSGPITLSDIPTGDRPVERRHHGADPLRKLRGLVRHHLGGGLGLKELKALIGDVAVEVALADAGGNTTQAAKRLQVTPRALQKRRENP